MILLQSGHREFISALTSSQKGMKILLVILLLMLLGCASYPESDGNNHAQPIGDLMKCADPQNHHLPTCYCHEIAIKQNPDRQKICSASLDGWLRGRLFASTPRSVEFVRDLRAETVALEKFQHDGGERWADITLNYLDGVEISDDCDALDSLLDIAFTLGGFRLDELAKVLVDTNTYDSLPADHYVAAIWVKDEWIMLDYFTREARPLIDLEFGGYLTKSGDIAGASRVVAYRRLSHARWYEGLPPKVMNDSGFMAGL